MQPAQSGECLALHSRGVRSDDATGAVLHCVASRHPHAGRVLSSNGDLSLAAATLAPLRPQTVLRSHQIASAAPDLARGTRCRGMTIAPTTEYLGQISHINQKRAFLNTTIADGQRVDRG